MKTGGPKQLRPKAEKLKAEGFSRTEIATILNVSVHAVSYALTAYHKREAKKRAQRLARQDPEQRRIDNMKRRIRREAARSADGRTKAQKCRDAALRRPRNDLGQLVRTENAPQS